MLRKLCSLGFGLGVLSLASTTFAATVTLDMNGFANLQGGHLAGPGIDGRMAIPADQQTVKLDGLQPGGRYSVDFYHNTGPRSSDFIFNLNDQGTIESVSLGGGEHQMVVDFEPGASTLKLNTKKIVYNVDGMQTGRYFISGVIAPYKLDPNAGPQTLTVIPGAYRVDNLYNSGGTLEDFTFVVNDQGRTMPAEGYGDYAEYQDNTVRPRAARVRFTIETAGGPVRYHATHATRNAESEALPATDGYRYTVEMPLTLGAGGLNIWSFGSHEVDETNVLVPVQVEKDGVKVFELQSQAGVTARNDYQFRPILRWSEANGFHFETTEGVAQTATGRASGYYDGDENPLAVEVKAEILGPYEPAEDEAAE